MRGMGDAVEAMARDVPHVGPAKPSPATPTALQGLRLLCALTVMTNHWADESFDRLVPQAQLAVDMLFGVEGWLAAHLLVNRSGWSAGKLIACVRCTRRT